MPQRGVPPPGLTDQTDYAFEDSARKVRVTVTPLGPVAGDDALKAHAWEYIQLAGPGSEARLAEVDPVVKPLASRNGRYVVTTLVEIPPGAEFPEPMTERSAFIRFDTGTATRLARLAPSNESDGDAEWTQLLGSATPARVAGGAEESALHQGGKSAGAVTLDLPAGYTDPTKLRFTDTKGVAYHVELAPAGGGMPSVAESVAEPKLYERVSSARGAGGSSVQYEVAPDPWADPDRAVRESFGLPGGPEVVASADTPEAAATAAALRAAYSTR